MTEKRHLKIAPSILTSDFTRLGETIDMLNSSQCDYIHLDVMDGVFVPNISILRLSGYPQHSEKSCETPGRTLDDSGPGPLYRSTARC